MACAEGQIGQSWVQSCSCPRAFALASLLPGRLSPHIFRAFPTSLDLCLDVAFPVWVSLFKCIRPPSKYSHLPSLLHVSYSNLSPFDTLNFTWVLFFEGLSAPTRMWTPWVLFFVVSAAPQKLCVAHSRCSVNICCWGGFVEVWSWGDCIYVKSLQLLWSDGGSPVFLLKHVMGKQVCVCVCDCITSSIIAMSKI